jgi:hypothetical protein
MRHWTPEEKARACEEILAQVRNGKSLKKACANGDDWVPSDTTFDRWCEADPELAGQYARARDARADAIFEEIIEIADDGSRDVRIDEEGREVVDHDHIARSKLRVDTRRWAVSKMNPKKYGDKLDLNHGGGLTVTLDSDADKL